jgi:hypothetical protein
MDAREVPAMLLQDVEGAIPRGTPIRKVNSQLGDVHPDGTSGEVVASVDLDGVIGYFVAFGDAVERGVVTFVTAQDRDPVRGSVMSMIQHGDFSRPAQIRVQDGERRNWLGRKRPVWRVIFVGFVQHASYELRRGTEVVVVDAMHRRSQQRHAITDAEQLHELFDILGDPEAS